MPGFTHLHVHSEYSLLDGLARVPDLVKTATGHGFDALALTDHGVMFGAVQFYQKATNAGLKPIIGCELYVAERGRKDKQHPTDTRRYHLTALAADETGYRNLVQLVSLAQLEGFYHRPRVDHELLERFSEGLIILSGCGSAEVPRYIREGQLDKARQTLEWYRDVFGRRYFIEVMNHDIPWMPALNQELVRLARAYDLKLVATNDVHYARAEDVPAHEVLLCIQTSTTITDPDRMRIGDTFYMRSEAEMRALFPELPEAIDNTALINEMCNVTLGLTGYKLPKFEVPGGDTAADYLRRLCMAGLAERYPVVTDDIRARLDYELSVIEPMGFADYFLIVWDLCRFARETGIWWNVRGSGAGSIVAYCLHITNIDPLAHGLMFERFLNPDRINMPDIDLDFPDDQRDLMMQYTYRRYGQDHVAQIITFGTLGARAAIRDVGRALDMPLTEVDRVARLIPAIPGKPCTIADVLRPPGDDGEPNEFFSPDLVNGFETDPDVRRLLQTAQSLEGVTRHASTHAAGVVITDVPLVEYLPLHRPTRGGGGAADPGHGAIAVTQYAMNDVEALGLLKVDFLGLSTLTVMRRAASLIERYHGRHYTLENIPIHDQSIYDLLSSGEVTGVFQVEGAGLRRLLREMRPWKFEHVVAAIALYRPGPMDYIPTYVARMHGREPIEYRHPALEAILGETYAVSVYQEQVIQIARDLAGYTAGEGDMMRKAVGKKKKEDLLKHRVKFVAGAVANQIPRATAEGLFDDIEQFARYGFNKAHAADYAMIVCQTAYLKANYPVEYMAALLSVERDDTDKIAIVAADCHRMGIRLLAPSISFSELDFTIEPLDAATVARVERGEGSVKRRRGIRFGLAAVKNVGDGPVQLILDGRADGKGPFRDLDDLCRRVDLRQVGKRALESLIKAGALDEFGPRHALLAMLDRLAALSASQHEAAARGQFSLFGGEAMASSEVSLLPPLPEVEVDAAAVKETLIWEKELIGLYLSEHPLHRVAQALAETVTVMLGGIDASLDGQPVTVAGMVTSVRKITTKKGDPMAFVRLEDLEGAVEVTVFPRVYAETKDLWVADNLILLRGKVEQRDERMQVLAEYAESYRPETVQERTAREAERTAQASALVDPMAWAPPGGEGADRHGGDAAGAGTSGDTVVGGVESGAESVLSEDSEEVLAEDLCVPMDNAATRVNAGPVDAGAAGSPSTHGHSAANGLSGTNGQSAANGPSAANGHSTTNGQSATNGAKRTPAAAAYRLQITLPRSTDAQADIQRLGEVYRLLISYQGGDRFTLFVPNGSGLVELEFPNSSTRYCVALLQALEALVGGGRIDVAAVG